ncbi:MAG: hypothetical protein V4850_08905 [Myxococcota bacterium]
MHEDPTHARAGVLFEAWVLGELDGYGVSEGSLAWDRRVGRLFTALTAATGFRTDLEHPADDERAARRWCWAEGWSLMSQDEDLLLMDDAYMRPLLEEAAAGCTKRAYALAIVAHHVRDSLHTALWPRDTATPGATVVVQAVDAALTRAADLLPLAPQDAELIGYLERLVSYRRPHKVGWDEATARVLDVRTCHPDASTPVVLHQRGKTWIAELPQAHILAGALHIDVGTGRMSGVPATKR